MRGIKEMAVNTKLSVAGMWRLINAVPNGDTPEEIRERAHIAFRWLDKNENVHGNWDLYDEMHHAITYWLIECFRNI